MRRLRGASAFTLAAICLLGATLAHDDTPTGIQLAFTLAIVGLATLAYRFPPPFSQRAKKTLGNAVLFAAILLFPPTPTMLITGAGHITGEVSRRRGATESRFSRRDNH